MLRVRLITDPFNLAEYREHTPEACSLLAFLRDEFGTWPETARLYRDAVAVANDITPATDAEADAIDETTDGLFYVVVYPGDPVTAIVTAVAVLALTAAVLLFLTPKIPNATQDESSNNSLGGRSNKARPNGRIEDIFGEVISVPTLLTVPLVVFEDQLEVEHCYMAVGRGAYTISDVRDGDTPINQIAGAGVRFYGPDTSPNSGVPFYSIGAPITLPLLDVIKQNEVNGQALRAPNANSVHGDGDIRFVAPDRIERNGNTIDFTKFFAAGDAVAVQGANIDGTTGSISVTTDARYLSGGQVEFSTLDPATKFKVGDTLVIENAGYAGEVGQGVPVASRASRSDGLYQATKGSPVQDGVAFEVLLNEDSIAGSNPTYMVLTDDGRTWAFSTGGAPFPSDQLRAGKILRVVPSYGGNVWVVTQIRDSGVVYADLSGQYLIAAINGFKVTLDNPGGVNADWNRLSGYPNMRTGYRSSKFTTATATAGKNLNGTYQALAVTAGAITLANPAAVNAAWNNIGAATPYLSPTLSTQGERWVGPFTIDMPTLTQVVANFTAPQGMYRVTKKGKNRPASVQIQVEVTPVNDQDNPIGAAQLFPVTLSGDGTDKKPKGVTAYAAVTFTGRCRVRARRVTPVDNDTEDTIIDEVQWRDGYGTAPVTVPHFGNITTVHTRTYATSGATSVKERKLNCRAMRRVLERNPDNTFGPALVPSTNAADIICHMALDPFIGGRSLDELDVVQIYDTIDEVQAYFGIPDAGTFSYTFDQDNISAEEMIQAVAQAVFCVGYRQGSILRLSFERATEDSILLFNHRSKVPGSETRTITMGNLNDHDGVELDYVSGRDGAKLTIYIPEDQSAVKAKKIEIIGVVDNRGDGAHPYLHAARAWNKIRYQSETTEFQAYGEASQLVNGQRIEVADNTRPDVDDGQVEAQDGLVLELSQPFAAEPDTEYNIFLQLPSGSVERLSCVAGEDAYHVVLAQAPSEPLVTDVDAWAQATYQIVKAADDGRETGFILTEKGPYDKKTVPVQAINYDPRYYQDDTRFAT